MSTQSPATIAAIAAAAAYAEKLSDEDLIRRASRSQTRNMRTAVNREMKKRGLTK